MIEVQEIAIKPPYITLGAFLKLAGIISTGGETRSFLAGTAVFVNQELDVRRGRKLYPGDHVSILDQHYRIQLKDEN